MLQETIISLHFVFIQGHQNQYYKVRGWKHNRLCKKDTHFFNYELSKCKYFSLLSSEADTFLFSCINFFSILTIGCQ